MSKGRNFAEWAGHFWARVDCRGDDECWPWKGQRIRKSYGRLFVGIGDEGYLLAYAHRAAFALANGGIDPSLMVLHACDNPPCCNPKHLSQGTALDNMTDCRSKGRRPPIEAIGTARLTERDAFEVHALFRAGRTREAIAEKFGVTRHTIVRVLTGYTWVDVHRRVTVERERARTACNS